MADYKHDKDCSIHAGYGLCNCGVFLRREGKPDSEPRPHDPYDVALEREEFGDYTKAVERVQPIELDIPDRREYPDDPISQLSDDVLRESRIRKGREWLKEHGLLPNGERVQPELLNELDKDEWWDVVQTCQPQISKQEFELMWNKFQTLKEKRKQQ